MTKQDLWTPPGPGSWKLDVTHLRAPLERLEAAWFGLALEDAFRSAFAQTGMALGDLMYRGVPSGWFYGCALPIRPEQMPERIAAATATLEQRPWREVAARWRDEESPAYVARIRELQQQEPTTLDDSALLAHLRAAGTLMYEGFSCHLVNFTLSYIGVGDYLAQAAKWADVAPWDVVETLAGYSPGSTLARTSLEAVASVVRESPAAKALFDGNTPTLAALRATSAEVAAAIDGYLEEYGYRTLSGFHLSDVTLREQPQALVETLAAVLEQEGKRPVLQQRADAAAARLRERVAPEHREAFDQALAEARSVYGSNDVDVVVLLFWPLGLLRRAALAAGDRLVSRGRIAGREHVFDASPDEVAALLTSSAGGPTADELATRYTNRLAWAQLEPPLFIGDPPQGPPPPGVLPPAVERVTNAFGLAWSLVDEDGQPAPQTPPPRSLTGHAASAGVYEGTARIVRGPEDFGRLRRGDVLVTRTTCPTYNVVLPMLGAIVTDRGGVLCHAAVVSREFGIPAVVGTKSGSQEIPDGARVRVDGAKGIVSIL